jgi:hypothetical protein
MVMPDPWPNDYIVNFHQISGHWHDAIAPQFPWWSGACEQCEWPRLGGAARTAFITRRGTGQKLCAGHYAFREISVASTERTLS